MRIKEAIISLARSSALRALPVLSLKHIKLALIFLPGVLVILCGVALFYSPRLALFVLAGSLVFFGAGLAYLAVCFLRLANKFGGVLRQLQGRVIIQGVALKESSPAPTEETGKIVFH